MGEISRGQLAALLQSRSRAGKANVFSPEAACFGPQMRAVASKAKRKVLRCGRRAGKTKAVAIKLFLSALQEPIVPVLYLTLTRENAREIIWEDLLSINEEFGLGGVAHMQHLEITLPNGGKIQLRGAHTERETSKIRGKKFKLAIIDEAQSFPDRILEPLIKDIVGPTLLDYQGELWLVGTPPPLRRGYFWSCYAGKLAEHREQHRWDIRDNVKLPARMAGADIEEILRGVREENGWTEDDPTYLREYLGEDVEDTEALLFQFREGRNEIDQQPDGRWTYVFGIDIGSVDSDAIAVWGWRQHDSGLYLVDEFVRSDQDVTDLATCIKKLIPMYHPISMVIDEGGGGKKTANELRRRHALPLKAAEKNNKPGFIRMMNADLRKGVIKVVKAKCPTFVEDCGLVRRDPEALQRGLLQELATGQGGFHSDICDGALYGWREAYHWLEKPAAKPAADEGEALRRRLMLEQRRGRRDPLAAALGFDD